MVWTMADIPSLAGKRFIVTGANSGIGWHAALELARADGELTIASRDKSKTYDAVARSGRLCLTLKRRSANSISPIRSRSKALLTANWQRRGKSMCSSTMPV